jgi:hypothetical protein
MKDLKKGLEVVGRGLRVVGRATESIIKKAEDAQNAQAAAFNQGRYAENMPIVDCVVNSVVRANAATLGVKKATSSYVLSTLYGAGSMVFKFRETGGNQINDDFFMFQFLQREIEKLLTVRNSYGAYSHNGYAYILLGRLESKNDFLEVEVIPNEYNPNALNAAIQGYNLKQASQNVSQIPDDVLDEDFGGGNNYGGI